MIVKLTRTTMIVPIVLVLAARRVRGTTAAAGRASLRRVVPWFLLWFVLAAAANTAGLVGPSLAHDASRAGVALITLALAAVGLSTRLDAVRRAGVRPLLLGALVWVAVATSSLLLIWATT